MNQTYPPEFQAFFEAMSKEMLRHKKVKGDSWKQMKYRQAVTLLRNLLGDAYDNYEDREEAHQLVDIANICGMLWCRLTGKTRLCEYCGKPLTSKQQATGIH